MWFCGTLVTTCRTTPITIRTFSAVRSSNHRQETKSLLEASLRRFQRSQSVLNERAKMSILYLSPVFRTRLTQRPDVGGSKYLWNVGPILPYERHCIPEDIHFFARRLDNLKFHHAVFSLIPLFALLPEDGADSDLTSSNRCSYRLI
jgi:hypothetical protein